MKDGFEGWEDQDQRFGEFLEARLSEVEPYHDDAVTEKMVEHARVWANRKRWRPSWVIAAVVATVVLVVTGTTSLVGFVMAGVGGTLYSAVTRRLIVGTATS